MAQKKMWIAYSIQESGNKKYWNRCGVAFENRDGSVNVRLALIPLNGEVQLRVPDERDGSDETPRGSRTGN